MSYLFKVYCCIQGSVSTLADIEYFLMRAGYNGTFDRKKKVCYKEEMCACLLSSLPLNKYDKREYFQQKRSRICHLKWWLSLHTNKGTFGSGVFRFCSYA